MKMTDFNFELWFYFYKNLLVYEVNTIQLFKEMGKDFSIPF